MCPESEYIASHNMPAKNTQRIRPHSSLKAWRSRQEFTQAEAAAHLGVSRNYYAKLERHVQAPSRSTLRHLMAVTGVPADELMGVAS